jgi:hypothetical protein
VSQLSRYCGTLNVAQPYGPPWPGTGIALPFSKVSILQAHVVSAVGKIIIAKAILQFYEVHFKIENQCDFLLQELR